MIALDPLIASINPESLIHALSFQAPEAPTPLATYAIEMIAIADVLETDHGWDVQALFHGVIDPVLGAFTEQAHRLLGVGGSGWGLGFGIWIQDQAALSG